MIRRSLPVLLAGMLCAAGIRAQTIEVVLFDEDDPAGADYREASLGVAEGGDYLLLRGPGENRMPVETDHAHSGLSSALLEWEHVLGGRWAMDIEPGDHQPFDLTGFDSLVVWLNGPEPIPGGELPRVGLRDVGGTSTPPAWLSRPENVEVDASESGFLAPGATNVVLAARYVNVLPPGQRRVGYPENLLVHFADAPLDTSVAAIGAPATPAHFRIVTEGTGLQLDFSFRDLDGDRTLGAPGEFVDVLMLETESSTRSRATWRIEVTDAPDPVDVPGEGDAYRLAVAFDELTLDADPGTWQRASLPMADLLATDGFEASQVMVAWFENGGLTADRRTLWIDRITAVRNDDESFLDELQERTFDFFWLETNPSNGLVKDRTTDSSPSSIAAVGFGLSAYTVGIDRGWITREQGRLRTLNTLRFFWNAPQGTGPSVTGYRGFFYHFLDMTTGLRRGTTELSTIDTALLLGGVLHAGEYFDGPDPDEEEIRALADSIYRRVDWKWAQNHPPAISHGWRPPGETNSGFISNDWIGYNEAMILYILALGSPTHPVEPEAWDAWTSGYGSDWRTEFGYTYLTFPPLFGHQYSHVWIDFRGIRDAYMRSKGIDYFENSRRATLAQRAYHAANPKGWPNYGADEWGLTASDTPTRYLARGAPPALNDEGTLAPTAPGGSIAFAPEEALAALWTMYRSYPRLWGPYGFRDAYNVSINWVDEQYLGIDQGPILLMAENHRSGRVWEVFMRNEDVRRGLVRAGFDNVPSHAEPGLPARSMALESYPNPFSARTSIRYGLDSPGPIRLVVFDLLGREISALVDGIEASGSREIAFDATGLAPGVYFARLTTEAGGTTVKLVVAR
jgi:hypothetical protein